MDNTQVNASDLSGIVIEEGGNFLGVRACDFEFFVQFTLDGAGVGGSVEMRGMRVAIVDMSADPDRAFGVQAGLTARLASGVKEDAIGMSDHQVGNQLFVRGVVLGR
jgi:hypothetical protein